MEIKNYLSKYFVFNIFRETTKKETIPRVKLKTQNY
jgi:hypothetical protein